MSATSIDRHAPRNVSLQTMAAKIKEEAEISPTFRSICALFAGRERTRHQVTLASLKMALEREEFFFKEDELPKCLKFMASLGIGRLDSDTTGNLRALKDIKVTLQSVGQAANLGDGLEKSEAPRRFKAIQGPVGDPRAPEPAPLKKSPTHISYSPSFPAVMAKVDANEGTKRGPSALTAEDPAVALILQVRGEKVVLPLSEAVAIEKLGEILAQWLKITIKK